MLKYLNIAIIAYSPLHQGLLTGKFHTEPERIRQLLWLKKIQYGFTKRNLERTKPLITELQKIADYHDVSPAQIALAWLIRANGNTVFAIQGASNKTQVEENIKVMQVHLSKEEMKRLDEII